MSFDLSALKFNVDTTSLASAITMVEKLSTSVANLKTPLKQMGEAAKTTGKAVEDSATQSTEASKKQTKQVDVMSEAVKAFYKEQTRLAKEDQKQKEQMFAAGASMNDGAVKAYEKYLDNQVRAQQKATDRNIREMERETSALKAASKERQTILERERDILSFMTKGASRGEASKLASAKARGESNDIPEIMDVQASKVRLLGAEPFDKSLGAIKVLKNELGALREAYRQTIAAEQASEAGSPFTVLTTKQTRDLYREKFRLIEQFKDQTNTELTTYGQLKDKLRTLNSEYLATAKSRNLLAGVNTIQQTKRQDQLQYLARATSVQLGDIGVSLAGGQNPLTVLIQQGDQLRGVFNQVGASGVEMKAALSTAFSQIVVGFKDVALVLGQFVLGAVKDTSIALASMAMTATGVTGAINLMGKGIEYLAPKLGASGEAVQKAAAGFKSFVTTIATPIVAVGVFALVAALATLAYTFYQTQQSGKALSIALATSGAGIQMNKEEAKALANEMANVNATSNDYVKILTEIALASKIPQEAVKGVAESAALSARFLGTTTKEVVDQFAKLQEDPVKVLTELGERTGHVSTETIIYIEQLIKQGEAATATAIAHKLLEESISAQSATAIGDMSPWDLLLVKIKDNVTLIKEEMYSLGKSSSVISALTVVWNSLASAVALVLYGVKALSTTMGATKDRVSSFIKDYSEQGGFNAFTQYAKQAAIGNEEAKKQIEIARGLRVTAKKIWNEPETGAGVKSTEAERATMNANKEAIEAANKLKEFDSKFANKSDLSNKQKAKKIEETIAQSREQHKKQLAGVSDQKLINDLTEKQAAREENIKEHFKPKKDKGAASAIKDEFNAQIQAIKNKDELAQKSAKETVELTNHLYKMGALSQIELVNQVAAAEKAGIVAHIDSLKAERDIASKKINSKKEVEKFTGDIAKAEEQLKIRSLQQDRALEENQRKIELNRNEDLKSRQSEIFLMQEKNKQTQLDNELIGLSAAAIETLTFKRLDETIAKQAEKIATLQSLGATGDNIEAIQLETQKLDALTRARNLSSDAAYKNFKSKMFGEEPDKNAPVSFGSATRAASKDVSQGNAIIGNMEAEKALLAIKLQQAGASDSVREADQKRFDELSANITSLQGRLNLTLTLSGLEDIASQMQGFAGGFTSAAQANLAEVTKKVSLMGSAYRASGKEILKHAQDQANAAARQQKAIGNIGAAIKNYGEIEKKNYNSTSEKMNAQVGGYAELAGAAKSYFEEGSAGYEVLAAAEQAFRAIQLAMSIAAMAQGATETTASIGNSLAAAAASTIAGVAKAFEQMGVWGFVGAAAILAFMASMGSGSGGGGGGGASAGVSASGSYVGTGTEVTATGQIKGSRNGLNGPSGGESPSGQADQEAAIAAKDAAEAFEKLNDSMRTAAEGMSQLETDLAKVKVATQGTGRSQHDLATQGMSESEIATYNYNAALRGQIMVLMDAANGTENASENMRDLANESVKLAIDLKRAQGDIAGANHDQMLLDTKGYTEAEVAVYDYNQGLKAQIEASEAGASAARDAAQAELDLAKSRFELSGRLNILLMRMTQTQVDRQQEMAEVTDAASIGMLNLIYQLEDMNTAIDNAYAKLERSIAAERKLAEARLNSAQALQSILKTAKDAATQSLTRAQAQAQLTMLLAMAKATGVLPDAEALKPALTALGKPSEELFANFVDYQRDFLKTSRNISDMSDLADKQVSIEEATLARLDAQLEAAKAQLDALRGIDTSVDNVARAQDDFNVTIAALVNTIAGAPIFSYTPPSATSGGGSGGGGGGGSGSGSGTAQFEDIASMTNKDIVAAYRAYYNRNPDQQGYQNYVDSHLTGDRLSQAILSGSAGNPEGSDYKMAISKGYDPSNPLAKWFKLASSAILGGSGGSTNNNSDASFAIGINNVPFDMQAQIHKGERILPAADNAELFARLASPEANAAVLAAAVVRLTEEVQGLRVEARQTVSNTGDTSKMLKRLGGEEDILTVRTVA